MGDEGLERGQHDWRLSQKPAHGKKQDADDDEMASFANPVARITRERHPRNGELVPRTMNSNGSYISNDGQIELGQPNKTDDQ